MSQQYAIPGSKNHIEKVAIVGARGHVGKFIVEQLLKAGKHKVTALSRKESVGEMPHGIEIKQIDYADPTSIVQALKGQEFLIITMSLTAPPDQSEKLIKAAAEAGVLWIMPNEFGAEFTDETERLSNDTLIGYGKRRDRALIESLGVSSWVGLCCGFWYELGLSGGLTRFGVDFQRQEMVFFDDGEQRINTSTWPQVGRSVASLLGLNILPEDENDKSTTLSHFRNRYCYISSFTVNQKDMFESAKRITGTTDMDWTISSRSTAEIFKEGYAELKRGDRKGFRKLLYSRMFFPGDNAQLFEITRGLDNDRLKLPKEDMDVYTMEAIRMVESSYFDQMCANHYK